MPASLRLFNDTIYHFTEADGLKPARLLDLGTYTWPYGERNQPKEHVIFPTKFMENESLLYFRFITDLFTPQLKGYLAVYHKKEGWVRLNPADQQIEDDLCGFLPVEPLSVAPSGEFIALLPAEQVVSWFEEQGNSVNLPAEIAALKRVGEEDNPVAVIMK